MMTDTQIARLIEQYAPQTRLLKAADGSPVWVAAYAELPTCLVEADSKDEALSELRVIAAHFLHGIAVVGGELPVPLSRRSHTTVTRVRNVFAGNVDRVIAASIVPGATLRTSNAINPAAGVLVPA